MPGELASKLLSASAIQCVEGEGRRADNADSF